LDAWFLVPARGGSRGVPRKNMRVLGDRPLIGHVLATLLARWPGERIVVMTDSEEIAAHAAGLGAAVEREPTTTGRATLDQVATEVARRLLARGADPASAFLTVQPTCPFLSAASIERALVALAAGAGGVLTVAEDRHLRWTRDAAGRFRPAYAARVNRQLLPPLWRETGGVIGARLGAVAERGTRILEPVELIEIGAEEALDIDDFADFAVAQYYARRRRLVIRADGARALGLGHVNRALALASELAEHQPVIATRADGDFALGAGLLEESPFAVRRLDGEAAFLPLLDALRPDLVFLDCLDSTAEAMRAVKARAGRVVTFEDRGPGAVLADLVINDLYLDERLGEKQLSGVEHALLAPAFDLARPRPPTGERVETLLVLFGGTDPASLSERTLAALAAIGFAGRVLVVEGPGRQDRPIDLAAYGLAGEVRRNVAFMPEVMLRADLAVSSAGRTVTELMCLGVPTLVLCQNTKELLHSHASPAFGVMNLGLGSLVSETTLRENLRLLLDQPELRRSMQARGLAATRNRSNQRIVKRILALLDLPPS
jgi:spore coat polysaccharide biosynthesis predicted glycosyltransferase SpsG/CMP-N-acetylneuraminic acid synthetase